MTQANLAWINREWGKWSETERALQINPSKFYKVGVEHIAKLFAAHCLEALASHAPSATPAKYLRHTWECGNGCSNADSLAGCDWEHTKDKWRDCTCGLAQTVPPSEDAAQPTPKRYWCCGADFGQHETTCHNFKAEIDNDH